MFVCAWKILLTCVLLYLFPFPSPCPPPSLSPAQREVVSEELEHISEQHQQLSAVFSAQSAALAQVEVEGRQMRERLALRESELARLRQKRERRASVNKVSAL